MQFSGNWLKELLDINISTEELCNQLTMLGIEVDNFTTYTSKITGEDAVIKLDITPNRGDCFSVLGIARDLSAFYDIKLKIPATYQIKSQVKSPFKVSVHKECPRYVGRYIDEIDLMTLLFQTLPFFHLIYLVYDLINQRRDVQY